MVACNIRQPSSDARVATMFSRSRPQATVSPGPLAPAARWRPVLPWLIGVPVIAVLLRMGFLALAPSFDFLGRGVDVRISETFLPLSSVDSLARLLATGLANTIVASLLAGLGALALGSAAGLAAASGHPLLRLYARMYIGTLRNIPLLLQVLAWYTLLLKLPDVRASLDLGAGFTLSHRGLRMPALTAATLSPWRAGGALLLAAISIGLWRVGLRHVPAAPRFCTALWLALTAAGLFWLCGLGIETPVRGRYNYTGGATLTPEFCALTAALSLYAGAYIADILRSCLDSTPRGQWEAARALGMRPLAVLWHVVLPQAWLAALPAVTNQLLNIIKNSSLAMAIGFPDLLWAISTVINATGRSVESVSLMLALYLLPALLAAYGLERLNRRNLRRQRAC